MFLSQKSSIKVKKWFSRGTFDFHANKTLLRLEKNFEQCFHQIALKNNLNDVVKSKHLSKLYLNSKKCSEQGA